MKSVLVLTGFGLAMLATLACRSSTPAPTPAPASRPEPPPIVEIVDKIEPEPPERVLSSEELLILKDDLKLTRMPEEGVEYVQMSRAGPQRYLKLKQQAPAEGQEFLGVSPGPAPKGFRIYTRASPTPRPVKSIAKQD